jgi:hypothetical protein
MPPADLLTRHGKPDRADHYRAAAEAERAAAARHRCEAARHRCSSQDRP